MSNTFPLIRRLAVLVVLFLGVACATSLIAAVFAGAAAWCAFYGTPFMQVQAAYQVSAALVFLFGTIATWRILLRWRSMNSQGKTLWMQSWSWSRIVGLMAVLLLVTMLVPVPNYESTILPEVEPSLLAILLNLFAKLSSLIVLPIIWFWRAEAVAG